MPDISTCLCMSKTLKEKLGCISIMRSSYTSFYACNKSILCGISESLMASNCMMEDAEHALVEHFSWELLMVDDCEVDLSVAASFRRISDCVLWTLKVLPALCMQKRWALRSTRCSWFCPAGAVFLKRLFDSLPKGLPSGVLHNSLARTVLWQSNNVVVGWKELVWCSWQMGFSFLQLMWQIYSKH